MKKIFTFFLCLCSITIMAQNQGGPDTYGYTWKNNSATNGPSFGWVDISSTGTLVTGLGDDNFVGPFNIGFTFQYYWTNPSTFYVGSNGYIAFNNAIQISSGSPTAFPFIPTSDGKDNFIAPFMSDLSFGGAGNSGECYYWSNNTDSLIISFIDLPFWTDDNGPLPTPQYQGTNTFQVILDATDSSIIFQYQDQQGSWDATYNTLTNPIVTGMENITGTIGLEVSTNLPTTPTVVKFYYPDSVTFSIVDVKPDYINGTGNKGFAMVAGVADTISGSTTNVGNTNVSTAYDVHCEIFASTNGVPSGSALFNEDFNVSSINAGQTITFDYATTFTPTAGIHHVITRTNLNGDLIINNDTIETELVVIDTTGVTEIDLSWTDGQLNGTFGFEGGAVHYIPPLYPVAVKNLTYYITDGDTSSPSTPFRARIWDDDGIGGAPGTILYDSIVPSSNIINIEDGGGALQPTIINLPSQVNVASGGFYVSWEATVQPSNSALLTDTQGPFSKRSYEVLGGIPGPYRNGEFEDLFIEATVSLLDPNIVIADFNASALVACPNDMIDFTNTSYNASSYAWTFDSGSPSTSMAIDPTVTWSTPGTYSITLVATGPTLDTLTKMITILDDPVAGFTMSNSNIGYQDTVMFTNTSTGADNYSWDFGDGGSDNAQDPSHIFDTTGTFSVCLTAINLCASDQDCQNVVVTCPSISADFSFTTSSVNATFTNTSSGTGNFVWDFDDGTVNTSQDPGTHAFAVPGSYNVCLSMTNGCDLQSVCKIVTVDWPEGIDDVITGGHLVLYPNPAGDAINIRTGKFKMDRVEVYNLIGELIYVQQLNSSEHTIEVKDLLNGVYMLKAYSDMNYFSSKFTVTH
ncbi:MAG: PKD domain-containing protein [Bacteroidetes bacterium]|nr:PKD domain-containing protein [Bacteroidota bacterium]